jgi:peptide chain release factor 2
VQGLQERLEQEEYSAKTVELLKQLKQKMSVLSTWQELDQALSGLLSVLEMQEEDRQLLASDIEHQIHELEKKLSEAETILFLSGPYDDHHVLFEIHVGNGGDDAEDFVSILLRMYLRFFEKKGWSSVVIDENRTPSGIKSVTVEVKGEYVYGQMKHEKGQHKLYRKSPFKATDSRQTSFATVIVTPVIEDTEVIIKDEDMEISTTRSSGAGGQKVNKTDSAVRIKHKPTGLVVECQTERSQLQNKQRAMMMLRSKLFDLQQEQQQQNLKDIRGVIGKADFGSQAIRIYILDTPKKIKDYRTEVEVSDIQSVLDGDLDPFIEGELAYFKN